MSNKWEILEDYNSNYAGKATKFKLVIENPNNHAEGFLYDDYTIPTQKELESILVENYDLTVGVYYKTDYCYDNCGSLRRVECWNNIYEYDAEKDYITTSDERDDYKVKKLMEDVMFLVMSMEKVIGD